MTVESNRSRRSWCRGVFAALALILFAPAASADLDVVAVVNKGNAIQKINIQELRLLYSLYRRSWEGGVRVVLVLPEDGTLAMSLLTSRIFRRRESREITDYYRNATFQQRIAILPQTLGDRGAIALVRNIPGAIALVERPQAAEPGVRIIEISH
ncbi:MAG: hypothetical protein GY910_05770 [bacterium]|nr:hypothetical protein [bacterium]